MKHILLIAILALAPSAYADAPLILPGHPVPPIATLPVTPPAAVPAAPAPTVVLMVEAEPLRASGVTKHPVLRSYRITNSNKKVSVLYFWNESGQMLQVVVPPGMTVEPIQSGALLSGVAGVHFEAPKGVSGILASGDPSPSH